MGSESLRDPRYVNAPTQRSPFPVSGFHSFPTRALALSEQECHGWEFNFVWNLLFWWLIPRRESQLPLPSCWRREEGLYVLRVLWLLHLACNHWLIFPSFSLPFPEVSSKLSNRHSTPLSSCYYLASIFHSWLKCSFLLLCQFTNSGLGWLPVVGKEAVLGRREVELQFSSSGSLSYPSLGFWRGSDPPELSWVGARERWAFTPRAGSVGSPGSRHGLG